MVQPVMKSLIESGTVRRGALGVSIQPLTPEHADYHAYTGSGGAVVSQVYPNSAAAKAGVQAGDIITSIDGRPIADTPMLMNTVASKLPGDSVHVELFRKGKSQQVTVTLGDRAAQFAASATAGEGPAGPTSTARELGLMVQDLTPEIAQQLNAQDRSGVVVARVTPDCLADRGGIARGDIIARVDETAIESTEDFQAAMSKANLDRGVALQVITNGAARIVILRNVGGR
jgi:serine protease Do